MTGDALAKVVHLTLNKGLAIAINSGESDGGLERQCSDIGY